ncbi:hypothetical protein ALC57_03939, partial [Trachymyrmex cornetzi]
PNDDSSYFCIPCNKTFSCSSGVFKHAESKAHRNNMVNNCSDEVNIIEKEPRERKFCHSWLENEETGTFAAMADPLARAVVLEGYSERGITPEQLTLFRGAVLAEMEGIQEGPLDYAGGGGNRAHQFRTRPAAAVLALLERQNPGIGALNWRVFAENVGASLEGRNYVFGILESSVLKLRGRDSKL